MKKEKTKKQKIINKIIIGLLIVAIGTASIMIYKNNQRKKIEEAKKAEAAATIEDTVVFSASTNMSFADIDVNFHTTDAKKQEIGNIEANITIDKKYIGDGKLKALELSTKLVSGLEVSHIEQDNNFVIQVNADKSKINEDIFDFVESLKVIDGRTINDVKQMLELNADELQVFLVEKGYACIAE